MTHIPAGADSGVITVDGIYKDNITDAGGSTFLIPPIDFVHTPFVGHDYEIATRINSDPDPEAYEFQKVKIGTVIFDKATKRRYVLSAATEATIYDYASGVSQPEGLPPSGEITPAFGDFFVFRSGQIDQNTLIQAPSGLGLGQSKILLVEIDGVGGYTITWDSIYLPEAFPVVANQKHALRMTRFEDTGTKQVVVELIATDYTGT